METNSRVFLLEPPKIQFEAQGMKEWGEVVVLLDPASSERRVNIFMVEDYCDMIVEKLKSHDFDPEADYICVLGSVLGMTFLVRAAEGAYGKIRLLMFNSKKKHYSPATLRKRES